MRFLQLFSKFEVILKHEVTKNIGAETAVQQIIKAKQSPSNTLEGLPTGRGGCGGRKDKNRETEAEGGRDRGKEERRGRREEGRRGEGREGGSERGRRKRGPYGSSFSGLHLLISRAWLPNPPVRLGQQANPMRRIAWHGHPLGGLTLNSDSQPQSPLPSLPVTLLSRGGGGRTPQAPAPSLLPFLQAAARSSSDLLLSISLLSQGPEPLRGWLQGPSRLATGPPARAPAILRHVRPAPRPCNIAALPYVSQEYIYCNPLLSRL